MALSATGNVNTSIENLDVLVVGAGFAGLYQLHCLRKKGYKVKVVDSAAELGGVWYWNCYPGARVDSEVPLYEYSFESLYKDWTWSEKFPSLQEIRRYFQYVDDKLDLSKDIMLSTGVESADFDTKSCRWNVKLSTGELADCKFFVFCTGVTAKRYIPNFNGLDKYKGIMHHTAVYPQDGIEIRGKKVAIIGTGASGVQCIQEMAPEVGRLTVFQRTPNLCLSMNQKKLDSYAETEERKKGCHDWIYKRRREIFAGFHFDFSEKSGDDDTAEQKKAFFEELWSAGSFGFWLATYKDVLFNKTVNDTAYEFWAEKTGARINDSKKKDILAPLLKDQPHTFGTKRPSLEQRYYEVFNQDNVEVIALKQNPIEIFTECGIKMTNGDEYGFDVIILATGFDSVTGGLCQIDIKGTDGILLRDKWAKSTRTYLGMATTNFPNMFFVYGPQSPGAFANGPTLVELQGDWVIDAIDYCTKNNKKTMDATAASEAEWANHVAEIFNSTLFPATNSWYNGSNIPGKKREGLNYTGGVPGYIRECKEVAENGYAGFIFDGPNHTGVKS